MRSRCRTATAIAILALLSAACGSKPGPELETSPTSTAGATTTQPTATTVTTTTTRVIPSGPTTSLGPAPSELMRPQLSDQSAVTTAGIGPLTFGTPFAQAQTTIGTRLITEFGQAPSGDCYYVKPEQGPEGVFFVVSGGAIERVEIRSGNVKTRSGYGIGTSVDQLKAAFASQLEITGDTYTFVPTSAGDANFRVVFETDGAKVTSFRAGRVTITAPLFACQ